MNRIIVLLAITCAVSPAIAERVQVDYDHGCSFSRYKTYRWVQLPATQLPEAQFPNQLMQERIVRYVEEAFAAKGLRRVETGGDLLVDYQVNVTEQQQFTTLGSGWGWDSAFSTTTTNTILTRTLVINLIDPRHKQLVFQAMAAEPISSKPQKNAKKLQKAVNEIFEKYPPKM